MQKFVPIHGVRALPPVCLCLMALLMTLQRAACAVEKFGVPSELTVLEEHKEQGQAPPAPQAYCVAKNWYNPAASGPVQAFIFWFEMASVAGLAALGGTGWIFLRRARLQ